MIGSGMEAEPKLHRIVGKSVDDIALLCTNPVDAKSYTFADSGIVVIAFSTSTGIGMPLMVCGETADSLLVSVAVVMSGGGGVSTAKGTTFLATASVQAMEVLAMEGSSFQASVMPCGLGVENSMTGTALEANPVVPLLALALNLSSCHDIILQCFYWKFVKDKCSKLASSPSCHGITSGGDAGVSSGMCPALQVAFFGVGHTGVPPLLIHFCDSINSKIGGAEVTFGHGGKTDGDPDKDSDKEPDGIDGDPAKDSNKEPDGITDGELTSFCTAPQYKYRYEMSPYKYGYNVSPRTYVHAVNLDRRVGNTMWQDATGLAMAQLQDYVYHICSDANVADTLSQHGSYHHDWPWLCFKQ